MTRGGESKAASIVPQNKDGELIINDKKPITADTLRSMTDAFFLIMEYCEHGDLQSYFDKYRNNPSLIRSLYKGVLEGVRFMHEECQIAHLDIKP